MDDFMRDFQMAERRSEVFGESCSLYQCRFDRDNAQVAQLEQARRYVANWEQMRLENMGLLLWGPTGSGKTFAAACIANALLETQWPPMVRMTTLGTVLNRLPAMSIQDKDRYLTELRRCDLLILDDFGMERQTDYGREQVFNLVDGRYTAGKPLIVTTNLTLKDMKDPPDLASRRICDRILELCVPVCFDRASLRPDIAKARLQRYRELTG